MNIKSARDFMNKSLQDESLRQGYRANIAMLIYDDQVAGAESRSNLSTVEGCNSIAERLIDLIFS